VVARRHRRHLPAAASIKKRHSLNNQQTQRRQRLLPLATSAACDQCLLPARAAPKCRGRQRAIGCRLGSAAGASALEVPRAPARDRLSPWKCRGRQRAIGGRLGSAAGASALEVPRAPAPWKCRGRQRAIGCRLGSAAGASARLADASALVSNRRSPCNCQRVTRQRLCPIGGRLGSAAGASALEVPRAPARDRLSPWKCRGRLRPIGGRLGSAAGACARSAVALELPARDASRRVSACVRLAVALEVPRAQAPDRLTRQRLSPIGCRHNNALSPATMGRLRPWVARDHGHQRPSPPACCAAKGCRGQKPRDGPAPQPPRLSCHLG